jgi:RimJ/RimL family protein N-acetyltransferase
MLRPPTVGDGAVIAEAVAESYDALHPWFHEGLGDREREGSPVWQEMIAVRFLAQFLARERLPFYAFAQDTLCAFVELRPDWRVGRHRLSYWVRPSMTGRGIGTEAVGAITRYAFGALDARMVTVGHAESNAASAALIARLGFELTARQPLGYEMPDGTLVDGLAYAMRDPVQLPKLAVRWEDVR